MFGGLDGIFWGVRFLIIGEFCLFCGWLAVGAMCRGLLLTCGVGGIRPSLWLSIMRMGIW